MGGIRDWLEGQGLEEFADAFEAERIDLAAARHLSDADLKELGLPMGPRRKLLAALSGISDRVESSADRAHADAERRQLTVMFVDLVGSTALSGRLDPEDYRNVITSFQEVCSAVIRRFDGYVARYLGDGILAYFGYPQAHEDDAERAVRAALSTMQAMDALSSPMDKKLEARVGIATGLVVVGNVVGEGVSEADAVSGETPNLAARLQALAKPGQIVICETSHRPLDGLFAFEDLGQPELKGISAPVRAWRVFGELAAESRFAARHPSALTAFVGRQEEKELLIRRWQRARAREGQVVLISGEPGIGKSRLTETLHDRVAGEAHTRLRYQCSPHHRNSALFPVIMQLGFAAGLKSDDDASAKLDKLELMLGRERDDLSAVASLFADLLSIPHGARYPPLNLSPQAQKERTLEALLDHILHLAERSPTLAVFEDTHWIDPTTQELVDRLVSRIPDVPVLMLLTFRPEYEAPWVGQPHVTLMALSRLTKRECLEMARVVAGEDALDEDVLREIALKTEGVPLFVEELTQGLLEGAAVESIPTTIQASLLSRLDLLGPAKEVAQVGAVIGRTFSYPLLAAVTDFEERDLKSHLDRLADSQLVFARGTAPDATYTFKHALVEDAAYQSLLRSARQQHHTRIASALEKRFPDSGETPPEVLARHCAGAGLTSEAVGSWQKAGDHALRRSANSEAVGHFTNALQALESLPESVARDGRELDIQTALGVALLAAEGPGSPEAKRAYRRAHELCLRTPPTAAHFQAFWGLWRVTTDFNEALGIANILLGLADGQDNSDLKLQAHHAQWATLLNLGRLAECRAHVEQGTAIYRRAQHRAHAFLYGAHDPVVCGLGHDSLALWLLGYPDQAGERSEEVVGLARELQHPPTLGHALHYATMSNYCGGNSDNLRRYADEMVELSQEQGFPEYGARAKVLRGWLMAEQGEPEAALHQIEAGLTAAWVSIRGQGPYLMSIKAEVLRRIDRCEDALHVLDAALAEFSAIGERQWESEIHRLAGECLRRRSPEDVGAAKRRFDDALAVARAQDAKSLELRAATSLARLWRDQGKIGEARELLAPVYGWFTEGFDTADLKDAKALLEELG